MKRCNRSGEAIERRRLWRVVGGPLVGWLLSGCLLSPDPSLWTSRADHRSSADGLHDAVGDGGRDVVATPGEGTAAERAACSPNGISTACDPIAQSGCSAGSCYPAKGAFACVCPAGTLAAGSSCNVTRECAPGHVCAGTSAPGICRPVCAPAAPACPSGTCTAITLYPNLGYCEPQVDAGI